jgi:hypothetical protein
MNLIAPEVAILSSFADAMTKAYPKRVVTRDLKDFSDRDSTELNKGIYTIVSNGQPAGDIYFQKMKFIVVGQIEFPEKSAGSDVENAELMMAREIKTLIQRQLRGPDLRVMGVDQSSQLEVPYGWVSVAIEAGPYDGTEPLTSDEKLGHLTDFITFRADIDAGQPHQSSTEHNKWIQDNPDYSSSKPDAQMNVTLES